MGQDWLARQTANIMETGRWSVLWRNLPDSSSLSRLSLVGNKMSFISPLVTDQTLEEFIFNIKIFAVY